MVKEMDDSIEKIQKDKRTELYVIIPVYNCIAYLETAVDSVLSQPIKTAKVILVDDGSNDGSSDLCNKLASENENVTTIHKENGGVSSARNCGIEYVLSKADFTEKSYIAFLDADDAWIPGFYNESVKKLMSEGLSFIGFRTCICDAQMKYRSTPNEIEAGMYVGGSEAIWVHSGQHFGGALYNIILLRDFGLRFPPIKHSEDKIFAMKFLFLSEKIYLDERIMYFYRQNASSAVHTRKTGIEHFSPFVDEYIKMDEEMAVWQNEQRGTLNSGKTLAGIYIQDMLDEHFEVGGTISELEDFLSEKKEYNEILNQSQEYGVNIERWNAYRNNPKAYRRKKRVSGRIKATLRYVYHLKIIQKILRKTRFPIRIY